jgi:16S rRNA (adenine1518-N6/adenine1519-N6)-dimethyltransferase
MQPKKSLGQNFLRDKKILDKIIEAANLKADDFILEVGPGQGVLTEELAKHTEKVVAIELDNNLIKPLKKRFAGIKNVEIIHADILKINLKSQISNLAYQQAGLKNYKVIANIPYYITSKIIRLFLESEIPPVEMILMVQKEVAERIVATPGQMSILAISVQYYAESELLFAVSRNSFDPMPEVDSAVIKISNVKSQISKIESKHFFRIVKAGFSSKRKTLVNNLSNTFQLDKKVVAEMIQKIGLKPTVRAQELSIENWKKLSELQK